MLISCLATTIVMWIAGVGAVGGTLGTLVLVVLAWKHYRQVGRVD